MSRQTGEAPTVRKRMFLEMLQRISKFFRKSRRTQAKRSKSSFINLLPMSFSILETNGQEKLSAHRSTLQIKVDINKISRARVDKKGGALLNLLAAGAGPRLFDRAAPRPRSMLRTALTSRPVSEFGYHFPKPLRRMFREVPFSFEGISHPRCGEIYFARAYPQHSSIREITAHERLRAPTLEFFRGECVYETEIAASGGTVLAPLAGMFAGDQTITHSNSTTTTQVVLEPGVFTYLRMSEGDTLKADQPFIAGQPLQLNRQIDSLPRLAMSVFVDGLAAEVFRLEAFESLMPNTHAFFAKGFVTLDARSAAEWTLPSVASISTGVRPYFHKACHRRKFHYVSDPRASHAYFPTVLQDMGFTTAQFCANWRRSGGYGYLRGFDRTLTVRGHYPAEQVVADAIEHMEVFRETHQYLWLTLFDLHHDHGSGAEFMIRAAGDAVLKDDTAVKSVFREQNEAKKNWYLAKIRRLDLMLAALFNYIENHYSDEDMVIGLFSDHGVSFLQTESDYRLKRLADGRVKVPVMFRGRNLNSIPTSPVVQNYDHFPTLMSSFAGSGAVAKTRHRLDAIDLTTQSRDAAISESIYPGQTYACRVDTDQGAFQCIGGVTAKNSAVDLSELTFFERIGGKWHPSERRRMPQAMMDVLREYAPAPGSI